MADKRGQVTAERKSMRKHKHNTLWLAMQIIRLHFAGWRQVPGYTVAEGDDGRVYFAVELSRP